jgi:ribonuclease-3
MGDWSERESELSRFCQDLGVHFTDLHLLDRALTHSSATGGDPVEHYESLEFIGDAALDLAVSQIAFTNHPGLSPGEYTQIRSQVVNNDALERVAKQLKISPFIRLGKGEEQSGGRTRGALLSDCVESIIGAIFLDSGFNSVNDFVEQVFGHVLNNVIQKESWIDHRSKLQNWCQAQGLSVPEYKVVGESGPDHQKQFEIEVLLDGKSLGYGQGLSKKEAEHKAASQALNQLNTG